MRVAISSGHGLKIRGAAGPAPWGLDEVDEARKVVEEVADVLRSADVEVVTFHDDVSTSQSENLNRIVSWHNSQQRELDVSCHFNAYQVTTTTPRGTECLYLTQSELAANVSRAIAGAGEFIDRGAKKRTDLAFLNGTDEPAILIETCFVDSKPDADLYDEHFAAITKAIADSIAGEAMQPAAPAKPPAAPLPMPPPTIGLGDRGSCVALLQELLEVGSTDGEFGAATEAALEIYQQQKGLSVDGVCGPNTWAALNQDSPLPPYPPPPLDELHERVMQLIVETAQRSALASYYWQDRGVAPSGYIKGMCFGYATMLRKLRHRDAVALITAQADRGDPEHDALSWYAEEFKSLDMDNTATGIDTLRHLFVLLMALGSRESSGRHCCGRDTSATNTSSDTAEAGLFQTSYNASNCSSDFDRLMDEYFTMSGQQTARDLFDDDVLCAQSEWANYGSGDGYDYQKLAKATPQFAVESTALVLRYLRQHWGPLNRKELDIGAFQMTDDLLMDIQQIIEGGH